MDTRKTARMGVPGSRAIHRRWPTWGVVGAPVVVSLLAASPANADNPRDVMLGGRTATMGGAGTAAGNDSAMPYLNPAGIGGVPGDIAAVSASVYGYSRRDVSNLFAPNGLKSAYGRYSVTESTTNADWVTDLPSSVMYFSHIGDPADDFYHVLGMSMVIPTSSRTEIVGSYEVDLPDLAGGLTMSSTAKRDVTDYYFGPTYAIAIDDTVRLGLSVYGVYSKEFFTLSFRKTLSAAGGAALLSQKISLTSDLYAVSVVPIAGLQVRIRDDIWAGAAVAAPSTHLYGRAFETAESSDLDSLASPQPVGTEYSQTNVAWYKKQLPLRLNAGIAYDDRTTFSAAADVHVYLERSPGAEARGTGTIHQARTGETSRSYKWSASFTRDLVQAVDVSIGAEAALTDIVALRGGFFTDRANSQALDIANSGLYEVREDRLGGTLGLGLTLGSFDTTVGVVYAHASGKMVTADSLGESNQAQAIVNTTCETVAFVVSGAVTTEQAKDTMDRTTPLSPLKLSGAGSTP